MRWEEKPKQYQNANMLTTPLLRDISWKNIKNNKITIVAIPKIILKKTKRCKKSSRLLYYYINLWLRNYWKSKIEWITKQNIEILTYLIDKTMTFRESWLRLRAKTV